MIEKATQQIRKIQSAMAFTNLLSTRLIGNNKDALQNALRAALLSWSL
jgi:hypothetical protein